MGIETPRGSRGGRVQRRMDVDFRANVGLLADRWTNLGWLAGSPSVAIPSPSTHFLSLRPANTAVPVLTVLQHGFFSLSYPVLDSTLAPRFEIKRVTDALFRFWLQQSL